MAAKAPNSPRKPRQAPARIPGQPAPAGDNSAHREEEERVQLISFTAKLTQTQAAVEAAKVPFDAAKKAHTQVFQLAKAAGFSRGELEERLKEMNDPARDMPARIEREARHRKWLGIIVPEQTEMQLADKAPTDAKDEAHWKVMGYRAGLRQQSSTPPTECPERHVQAFMKEHERGYLETATANAPKAPKPTVAEQAAADYAKDNPDLDAAARKLKNDPAFMARGVEPLDIAAAEALVEGVEPLRDTVLVTVDGVEVARIPLATNDGFEATPEELAAMKPRAAVVEAREAEEATGEII